MLVRISKNQGFTLIELIAGIVVFGVALAIVTSLVANQSRQSIDPIWQVRAVELGQSLLNEINAKAFDENADLLGGFDRCNEITLCSRSLQLGVDDAESRAAFDDVDDYHGLDATGGDILNSLGERLVSTERNLYEGFRAQVVVFYDDNLDGINDDDLDQDGNLDTGTLIGNRKLIQITIQTPAGDSISLSFVKANF